MKKTLLTLALSLALTQAQAGGNAGGSTEVTQIMNNTELLNLVSQEYQNYRTMVSRLQIMTQNALTHGLVSITPNEIDYFVNEINRFGEFSDSLASRNEAQIRRLKTYSKDKELKDEDELLAYEAKLRQLKAKRDQSRAQLLAQLDMSVDQAKNRQERQKRIRQIMSSDQYGQEKALRLIQQFAEQQQDLAETQIAMTANIEKTKLEKEQIKETEEIRSREKTLKWLGVGNSNLKEE